MSSCIPVNKTLIELISELLLKHGHPSPRDWERFVHPDAFISSDVGIQRFLINRYWREILGLMQEDTLQERQCLIDQGPIDDWLRLFEQGVIPCVMRNIQPKTKS